MNPDFTEIDNPDLQEMYRAALNTARARQKAYIERPSWANHEAAWDAATALGEIALEMHNRGIKA